jgi:multiple sugar transport system substrate-binding protein
MSAKNAQLSRRSFLKIAGLGATAGVVASCATPPQSESAASTQKPLGPAKVRYAHMNCWDKVMCQGQKDLIADFNSTHPNIQVESVEWSWGNYLSTLTAAVSAGEAPDVMHVGWGEVVSIGRPYFETIDSYLTDDLKKNIRPASWTSSIFDGKTYGVPVSEQLNEVLYYRTDVWEKAGIDKEPETWDDYVAVGKKLIEAGFTDAWAMQASGAPIITRLLETQFQNGSPMYIQDGDKWKQSLDTPEAIEAGKYWYSLWREHKIISQANLQRTTADVIPLFADGKIGMMNDIVQAYFTFVQDHKDILDKIRIAPVMRKKAPATMGGAFALSMFKQSKSKQAAWEFIQWATSVDVMNKYWVPQGKILPTRLDAKYPDMPDYIKDRLIDYQANQKVFPFIPEWESIKGKVLTPVLGEMATGAMDFDTGWENIIKQTDFLIG